MPDPIGIQREAARAALLLRRSLSIPRDEPVNVFSIAQSIGVEVFFKDLTSLEGMFYRGPDPVIVLPSLNHRPRGRVSYSCAHELGHFQLGHGTHVDDYIDQPSSAQEPEEVAADTFAATLLLPRPAVLKRFRCRHWTIESATPIQIYRAASELDVGYTTLLKHLRYGLGIVDGAWLASRERVSPKALRKELLPNVEANRVVIADALWPDIPIDLEVGDYILLMEGGIEHVPDCIVKEGATSVATILKAARQGEGTLTYGHSRLTVRVARAGYCGALKYRYIPDPEDQ